jgi:hypothetical protein
MCRSRARIIAMKTLLKRLLGVGMLGAAGYAMWRAYERRKIDTGVTWDPQPFPYPPQPHTEAPTANAPVAEAVPPVAEVVPEVVAESGWIEPDAGACPVSHPVKAKLTSGIFHVPGGANYDRTKPDRCYASAAAAETDGLRPAKH